MRPGSGSVSVQHGGSFEELMLFVDGGSDVCGDDPNAAERPDGGSRHSVSWSFWQVAGSPCAERRIWREWLVRQHDLHAPWTPFLKAFSLEATQASRAALGPSLGCGVQAEQRPSQQTESSFNLPTLPREQRPAAADAMMLWST